MFCLLGPNGAGKSTTINCLTGQLPLSGGEAIIHGQQLHAPGGIDRIRAVMGVCPQFDVLWGLLTGLEHMRLYAGIKGVDQAALEGHISELLGRVQLTKAADLRVKGYSGGMKRRLSVAIALMGDPSVIFLDEPTTGMDPISKRHVWEIIEEAKPVRCGTYCPFWGCDAWCPFCRRDAQPEAAGCPNPKSSVFSASFQPMSATRLIAQGRAIVLTTHSMEEADILGDRIAVMARGSMRCLGTSTHLKHRFGAGIHVVVVLGADSGDFERRLATIQDIFRKRVGVANYEASGTHVEFVVPKAERLSVVSLLEHLESNARSLGIKDVQVSMSSLEEVFLAIAKQAEVEAAQQLGAQVYCDFPLPDGKMLRIPVGADVFVDAAGARWKVQWAQGADGGITVANLAALPPQP